MTQYMLIFSLGPVQPFILQARKTRDLWIGSLLLSKLMRVAISDSDIKDHVVFPIVKTTDDVPGIPNKYVALFDSSEEAQNAARQSEKQIRDAWNAIQQTVWNTVIDGHDDQDTRDIWRRQTAFDYLFEMYWVVGERQAMGYGEWLNETESLFAARKRLRDFMPQNEPGEKSAISGEREVLRTKQANGREFWKAIAKAQHFSPRDIDLDGKERLDAIDTIKRFAMQAGAVSSEQPFPSTSTIATASFVEKLLDCHPQAEAFARWKKSRQRISWPPSGRMRQRIYPISHKMPARIGGGCFGLMAISISQPFLHNVACKVSIALLNPRPSSMQVKAH